jgi:uncharacterized protein (DUF433 family)
MTHAELLKRVSADPQVCDGRPCIRGHRIWVSLILDFLASGMTADEFLVEYPQLTSDDIRAGLACARAHASEMTRERTVHLA